MNKIDQQTLQPSTSRQPKAATASHKFSAEVQFRQRPNAGAQSFDLILFYKINLVYAKIKLKMLINL
jgi:hypothetical protein